MRRDSQLTDLVLFGHAVRLALIAREVRVRPLSEVAARLRWVRFLPRATNPKAAYRAAGRACARLARALGGLDTCLTRSLVTGALLALSCKRVELHVGFRPDGTTAARVDGHAWVTADGELLGDEAPGSGEPFTSIVCIPMHRESSP